MEHGGTQEKVMITCDDDQVLNLMMEIAVKLLNKKLAKRKQQLLEDDQDEQTE
jgi:hypothetical protein